MSVSVSTQIKQRFEAQKKYFPKAEEIREKPVRVLEEEKKVPPVIRRHLSASPKVKNKSAKSKDTLGLHRFILPYVENLPESLNDYSLSYF